MFSSIQEIKAANIAIGHRFFDPATMCFFDSRILPTVYAGRYFLTSEQFHGSDGRSAPRRYTIREALPSGEIETVGDFQQFAGASIARQAITCLISGHRWSPVNDQLSVCRRCDLSSEALPA